MSIVGRGCAMKILTLATLVAALCCCDARLSSKPDLGGRDVASQAEGGPLDASSFAEASRADRPLGDAGARDSLQGDRPPAKNDALPIDLALAKEGLLAPDLAPTSKDSAPTAQLLRVLSWNL